MPAGFAAFLGAAAGAGFSFTIAKFWAFGDRTPVDPRQVGAYGLVSLGTALIVALSVHTLVELAGVQYLVAKVASSITSFLFWSYPLQSRVVFGRVRRDPAMSIH
jgi:putative flippase GtrA